MIDTHGWCVVNRNNYRDGGVTVFDRRDKGLAEAAAQGLGEGWFVESAVRCWACNGWSPSGKTAFVMVGHSSVAVHDVERCRKGARKERGAIAPVG